MKLSLAFLLCLLGKISYNYAQVNTLTSPITVTKFGDQKAKPGTYQFIVYDIKVRYNYTLETFLYIEDQRKPDQDVTLRLNRMTEVYIPSRKKVDSPDFIPLPEYLYK